MSPTRQPVYYVRILFPNGTIAFVSSKETRHEPRAFTDYMSAVSASRDSFIDEKHSGYVVQVPAVLNDYNPLCRHCGMAVECVTVAPCPSMSKINDIVWRVIVRCHGAQLWEHFFSEYSLNRIVDFRGWLPEVHPR